MKPAAGLLLAILSAAATACGTETNCEPSGDAIPVAIKSISAGSVSLPAAGTLGRLNHDLRNAICAEPRLRLVAEDDTSHNPRAAISASIVLARDSTAVTLSAVDPATSDVVYSLTETGRAAARRAEVSVMARVFVRILAARLSNRDSTAGMEGSRAATRAAPAPSSPP